MSYNFMDRAKAPTRDEIEEAMNQFLAQGGSVKVLPSTRADTIQYVGGEKWGNYDDCSHLDSGS